MKARIGLCVLILLCGLAPAIAAAPDPNLNDGLREAARKGDLAAVKGLLAKGAEVNSPTEFGATALIFAADSGHLEIVKALLDGGADVNLKDGTYGSTAIDWAAGKGFAPIVELLLAKGATSVSDTLDAAIDKGHVDVAKVVLASGKLPKEALGAPLAMAKKGGRAEIAELLVKAGAVPLPKASDVVPAELLAKYPGTYRSERGTEFTVALDSGVLTVEMPFRGTLDLSPTTPKADGPFMIVGAGGAMIAFNLEAGQVTGLTVKPPEPGATFKKVQKTP